MFSSVLQSPIGMIKIEGTDKNITQIIFIEQPIESSPNSITEVAKVQLADYFSGKRKSFDLPLKLEGTDFQNAIWQLLQKIPFGQTITYQQLSKQFGNVKAIRAVAGANGKNTLAIVVPCHRVIGSDGSLTGYAWGLEKKEWLLQHEGALDPKLF